MKDEALKLALEALENSVDLVVEDAYNAEKLYGNYPTRQGKVGGLKVLAEQHKQAITAIKEALAQPEQEPVAKYCCHLCFNKSGQFFLDRMILCSECGNKRCPKATSHELHCTNSNEPNQAGSIYTISPQRPRVVFPTMLRKMWSGGEVQAWLDENVNKEKNNG